MEEEQLLELCRQPLVFLVSTEKKIVVYGI